MGGKLSFALQPKNLPSTMVQLLVST